MLIFTPAYIMVGQYFDKRKGTAMGLATIGSGLGNVVFAPLINFLTDEYDLFGTMLILGAIVLHTCAVALLYRPLRSRGKATEGKVKEEEAEVRWEDVHGSNRLLNVAEDVRGSLRSLDDPDFSVKVRKGGKDLAPDEDNEDRSSHVEKHADGSPASVRGRSVCCRRCACSRDSLFCNTTFIIYCFLMAGMQYAIMGTLLFVPGFAVEKGVDKITASLLLSIYGFVDLGARFLFAFVFDLKAVRSHRRYLYAIVGLMFGASTMVISAMPTYISLAAAVALNALCEAAFHSQRATILSEFVAPAHASLAVGLMIASQGVGNISGPPFAGQYSGRSVVRLWVYRSLAGVLY